MIGGCHGLCDTRIYRIWKNMKQRCYNPKNPRYNFYGKIGVKVCDEWKNNFISFYKWSIENGYQDNLTIDRIDVNGNYEPSNCRWITNKEQQFNKHVNHFITYNGETKTLTEWGMELGIDPNTLGTRLSRGWSIEKTLITPVKKHRDYNKLSFNGKTQSLSEWATELNLNEITIRNRLRHYGFSVEKAFTTPMRQKKRGEKNEDNSF